MIPTHKDLIIKGWVEQNSYGNDLWSIKGPRNILLGGIFRLNYHNPNEVHVAARLSNISGTKQTVVPLIGTTFNYQDYIPEWEQLMDELLKTLFK